MSNYHFKVEQQYTKNDIYKICQIPSEKQKGNWNTGYTNYNGDWFIFCNIGIAGRTGHDYQNTFIKNELIWYGKTGSHIGQESIKSLISNDSTVYIFFREEDRAPFTFAGIGQAKSYQGEKPIQITWVLDGATSTAQEIMPEEVTEPEKYIEGATKTISVNVYERNPQARQKCIDAYGYDCTVCTFNFEDEYGEIGSSFIHVHHLKQLANINEEYELDPIKDLRPVCPNCHAMLHKRRPTYSIEELIDIRKKNLS